MSLSSRLDKIEQKFTTDEHVVYIVWTGEDPEVKRAQAWQEYQAKGGTQLYDKTTFVQINKLIAA